MGTLTLTDLKAEITSSHGGRTDIAPRLTRVLNLSQMRIARINLWEDLESLNTSFSTVSGNRYVDISAANPHEVLSVVLVDGTSSKKLTRRVYRQLDKIQPYPEAQATGKPDAYEVFAKKIELFRIPDAGYPLRIRLSVWPTAFVDASPSAVSDLDMKDDMLIALTNSWLFLTLGKSEDAQKWWNIYRQMLSSAVSEESRLPDMDFVLGAGSARGLESDTPWANPFVRSIE